MQGLQWFSSNCLKTIDKVIIIYYGMLFKVRQIKTQDLIKKQFFEGLMNFCVAHTF